MHDAVESWNSLRHLAWAPPGPLTFMIRAGMELTVSWTRLFEIVCNRWNDPLQDHRNIWLCRRRCLHDQIRRYFKLFAKVRMSHSRTIKIYDCSWGGAWILMDDTIWNRLQQYAWPTPGPSESMTIAETVLSLSWTMLFEIVCKTRHGQLQNNQNVGL